MVLGWGVRFVKRVVWTCSCSCDGEFTVEQKSVYMHFSTPSALDHLRHVSWLPSMVTAIRLDVH